MNLDNQNINTQQNEDEIDLIALINEIWQGKWIIILISAIIVFLTALYLFIIPQKFTASLEIRPLSQIDLNQYIEINALGSFFPIKSKDLMDQFIEQFGSKKQIIQAIEKNQFIDQANYENEINYKQALSITASNFNFYTIIDKKSKLQTNTVEFKGVSKNENKMKFIFNDFLQAINESIRAGLENQFNKKIESLISHKNFEIQKLEKEIEIEKTNFEMTTRFQIEFLKEQAEIAKFLGISKNDNIQIHSPSNLIINNFDNKPIDNFDEESLVNQNEIDQSYYLKGFELIEKEKQMLDLRMTNASFNKNVNKLKIKIEKTKDNTFINRIRQVLSNSPIADKNQFAAFNFDINALKIHKTNPLTLLILASFFGLFLGIIVLITKNRISKTS